MGVSVAYRGRFADPGRIEDFEDRLLDLALEIGGLARIWRSYAEDDPRRMVRGVILDLAPGQESTSMLISPEGWLIGLCDIKDAEQGRLEERPWCATLTQHGPVEGHVALVEMLTAVKREFMPDLEVTDEGGYWERRDLAELIRRRAAAQNQMPAIIEGLQPHGRRHEAAEDREILQGRVERVCAQVQRILGRPAEHPPLSWSEAAALRDPDPEITEAAWDRVYKLHRRETEWTERALKERRAAGEDDDQAFENALRDVYPEDMEESSQDEEWEDDTDDPIGEYLIGDMGMESANDAENPLKTEEEEFHPLLARASNFKTLLHAVFRGMDERFVPPVRTLFTGADHMVRGLHMAFFDRGEDVDDYGLRVTHLKRALRGAAFARGALLLLLPAGAAEQFVALVFMAENLEHQVFEELGRVRAEYRTKDEQ
jgi:hypothetical protein